MPRPRRGRRAPAQPTKHDIPSDNDDVRQSPEPEPARGRGRRTRSVDAPLNIADKQALEAANLDRDAALERLADEDPTTTTALSGNTVEDSESGGSIEMGRRGAVATPEHRRDTTGLDLADDDVFGDLDDSFEDGTVPGVGGTTSADTSSLNLSLLKRRPRASSIIGRNDPPIRPSSRGANTPSITSTLNLGVFRRRAREPSILGTARKPMPDETETIAVPSDSEEASEGAEEEFAPEAESTPLDRRRRTRPQESERGSSLSPRAFSRPKAKKRKSEDAALSSDRPEKISRVDAGEASDEEPEVANSDSSSLSSLSSPRGPPAELPARPVTPINDEEIMAPPVSSDSEQADGIWPDIHTLAKRRRRPSVTTPLRAGDDISDISSPPSLTHSPNYEVKAPRTRGRAQVRRQASPKVTTADLTSMLPKRKYKKDRDPFDLESDEDDEVDASGLGNDEDELSYIDTAAARRRRGSRPPSRATSRPGSRGGRNAHTALQPRQTSSSAAAVRSEHNSKTYSRRASDKENEEQDNDEDDDNEESMFQPLPDDTFEGGSGDGTSTPSADELKRAARKFREVDRWELEFEEMTQSSSPPFAR